MAKYGKVIDSFADPNRLNIYSLFVEYFENPFMKRIKQEGDFVLYAARFSSIGALDFRYLILVVPMSIAHSDECYMQELQWMSLQTRISTTDYRLKQQVYVPRRLASLNVAITRVKTQDNTFQRTDKFPDYIYSVEDFPFLVKLLPKKNSEYRDTGTLLSALETYSTVVYFE